MVTWVTWVRGLRGSVGAWVAWVKFLRGLRGLRESKYFLRGSTFYVGHNFLRGLRGSNTFLRGSIFFVVFLKNIDWRFGNNILVVHYICIKDMLNQHPISCNSSCT